MKTKKFKTQRGYLDYIAKHGHHGTERIYDSVEDFFKTERHFYYYTNFRQPNEKYHSERLSMPWVWKYEFAVQMVNFHWKRKTKAEREAIALALAKGEGDLSMLQSFQIELRKEDGEWLYNYCTSGLSGPNYDYCKREYLKSI